MQIFIDTANLQEIKEAISWGIVDGVTTNPSLIKKEVERLKNSGQTIDMTGHIRSILQLAGTDTPVSLEVTATDATNMIVQGRKLHADFNQIANNVVVKIPVNPCTGNTFDGLKAIKTLEEAEIPVNATLIFTPEQALLAARAGATYVSPFAGRIDDHIRTQAGTEFEKKDYFPAEGLEAETEEGDEDTWDDNGILSGVDLVTKIADLFEKHEIDCNIIAASLRNNRQVRECALAGATIGTIPFSVLKSMIEHAKTTEGMKKFTADIVPEYAKLLGGSTPTPQAASMQQSQPVQQPSAQQSTPSTPPSQPQQMYKQPTGQPVNQNPEQRQPSAYDLMQQRQQ